MRGPLNLASRPFRNEVLPALLLGAGGFLLLVATIVHGVVLWSVAKGGRHARVAEIQSLEKEEASLRLEIAQVPKAHPTAANLAEWRILKELVDRRSYSWTGIFSRLEEILPPGVRIGSLAPKVEKGQMVLEIDGYCQSPELGLEFLRRLQKDGDFKDVYPLSATSGVRPDSQFRYVMTYLPASSGKGTP
jgi:Tfp pilus assembly protein PilN